MLEPFNRKSITTEELYADEILQENDWEDISYIYILTEDHD
jgi:hypothetical protein